VATVRGITSRVDIIWRSDDGTELENVTELSSSITANKALYRNFYTAKPLITTDTGTVYQCEGVINTRLPVRASNNFTVTVAGKLH